MAETWIRRRRVLFKGRRTVPTRGAQPARAQPDPGRAQEASFTVTVRFDQGRLRGSTSRGAAPRALAGLLRRDDGPLVSLQALTSSAGCGTRPMEA